MSTKMILFMGGVALLVFVAYVFKDRIPGPSVTAKRPYSALNGHKVAPLEAAPAQFEVLDRPGAIGRGYFCAAAKYAEVVLRADPQDHIQVIHALGPSRTRDNRRAVGFAVVPRTEVSDSNSPNLQSPSVDQSGASRSILSSRRLCAD